MSDFNNFMIELRTPDEDNASLHLKRTCTKLFNENQFCDVTFSCKDGQIQAHRMMLSASSSYLYKLFTSTPWPTPCSHPVILLRNSAVDDVRSVMEFIYTGITKTSKDKLQGLLEVGRELECTSLVKSIETAVQNCGVAMFRKLVTPVSFSNRNKATDLGRNLSLSPLVKQEPIDLHDQFDQRSGCTNYPMTILQSAIMKKSDTKEVNNIKMRNGVKKSGPTQLNINANHGHKNNQHLLATIENTNSEFTIQHSKAESFVYTNKDLGMDFGGHENVEDEEPFNEIEMKMSQEDSINNDISISAVPQFMFNGRSNDSRLKSPLKVEIKNDSDGVPASCPWCLQVFTSLPLLQRHIKSHVGIEKPKFVCEYCNTKFGRSAHLKRHLRTHTGEKPYLCGICQTRFARQDKLKIHLERHLQNANAMTWKANSAMTVTSYPPPAVSQSLGGHLPIKVLIPTNNKSLNSNGNIHMNGNGTTNLGSSSSVSTITTNGSSSNSVSPPFNGVGMRMDKVAKLSPSTTITSVSVNVMER